MDGQCAEVALNCLLPVITVTCEALRHPRQKIQDLKHPAPVPGFKADDSCHHRILLWKHKNDHSLPKRPYDFSRPVGSWEDGLPRQLHLAPAPSAIPSLAISTFPLSYPSKFVVLRVKQSSNQGGSCGSSEGDLPGRVNFSLLLALTHLQSCLSSSLYSG